MIVNFNKLYKTLHLFEYDCNHLVHFLRKIKQL